MLDYSLVADIGSFITGIKETENGLLVVLLAVTPTHTLPLDSRTRYVLADNSTISGLRTVAICGKIAKWTIVHRGHSPLKK